ncbi:MAG TPA: hypothetical protein DCM05_13830 [Elusimicrobia bacterium]|nr:hypothetical protein [Elusimicrobiota bacterium]
MLRRDRVFKAGSSIVSRLPDAQDPSSRRVRVGALAAAPSGFVDARDPKKLRLKDAVDRIVCGDAASVLKRLPREWCACAVTSPPYWNTVDYGISGQIGQGSYQAYLKQLSSVWKGVERCLLPNGKFCLNVPLLPLTKAVSEPAFGKTHTRVLLDQYSDIKAWVEKTTRLRLYSLYVWEKQTTEKMFGSYPYPPNLYERNTIEFIAVFVKPGEPRKIPLKVKEASRLGQAEWLDLTRQVWWMYPENVRRQEGHPAPFPEALPNRLINMYTFRAAASEGFEGDVVLDPLCGSGMTCVAARRLGRRFVGIDLNPEFCAYAAQRARMTPVSPSVMSAARPSERKTSQGELAL